MTELQPTRPVVFYDGGCPKCRREIGFYRRRRGAEKLDWIDIHAEPAALAGTGIRWEDAMRYFHFLDGEGRWRIGVDGFAALWEQLPAWRWLASLARLPGLYRLLEAAYRRWADRRFPKRMRECDL
jgi:predicted DCC family thiol-disulfide oxidoreductase YuxK